MIKIKYVIGFNFGYPEIRNCNCRIIRKENKKYMLFFDDNTSYDSDVEIIKIGKKYYFVGID